MNKSDEIGELAKALCKVQAAIRPAIKDANNPFFKSTYADLNSVWNAARDLITANGLSVAQVNGLGLEHTVIIETVLMHESGQWISGELSLPLVKNDPQGVGSAITYGRRYGLAAILGIVADVDDDGNHASGKVTNGFAQKAPEAPTGRDAALAELRATFKALSAIEQGWTKEALDAFIGHEDRFPGVTVDLANEAQLKTVNRDLIKYMATIKPAKAAKGGVK